jgi:DNA-binding transcriptional ArsR family regulator
VDQAFRAIAEPRRREIVRALLGGELAAGAIAERFRDVTRPAVSQHLRVLKDAGLLAERRVGTRRLYRLRPERLAQLRAYLDAFWGDRLDVLREAAQREARRG